MKRHRVSSRLDDLRISSSRQFRWSFRYTLQKYVEARLGGRVMTKIILNRVWTQIYKYRRMDYED